MVAEVNVAVAPPELEAQVDDALGLHMISIRLEKQLIEEFKLLGEYYGMGYQPLMRDVLGKWARTELSVIAHDLKRQLQERRSGDY
jgi:uncharacterized protein (DUF4415 family)